MDDRQTTGIKEGAGLEESRVNQEFVDFLQKWSQPVLLLIVIVSAAWFGWQRWTAYQVGRTNDAFAEYEAVAGSQDPLPASLRSVAETYANVGSIAALAQLRLGDVHLAAVRRGLEPGAVLGPDGQPESETDILDDAGREDHLSRAATAFGAAIDATADDKGKAVLTVSGHFGLAAVAEARGEMDEARAQYERGASIARDAGLNGLPEAAEARIASLSELPQRVELPSRNDLPVLPGFPAPDVPTPADDESTPEGPAAETPDDAPAETPADTPDAPPASDD